MGFRVSGSVVITRNPLKYYTGKLLRPLCQDALIGCTDLSPLPPIRLPLRPTSSVLRWVFFPGLRPALPATAALSRSLPSRSWDQRLQLFWLRVISRGSTKTPQVGPSRRGGGWWAQWRVHQVYGSARNPKA